MKKTLAALALSASLLFGVSCDNSSPYSEPPKIPGTNRRYLHPNDQVTYTLASQPGQLKKYCASYPKDKSEEVQVFGEIIRAYNYADGSVRIIDVKPITEERNKTVFEEQIRREGYTGRVTFQQPDRN